MKAIIRFFFGGILDRLADEATDEVIRLSHCHRCGACVCYQHSAISDDEWDEHRVICQSCFRRATPPSKSALHDPQEPER